MQQRVKKLGLLDASLPRAKLGESPLWHSGQSALHWVDIEGHRIYRYAVPQNHFDWRDIGYPIGFIALRQDGGFIGGLHDGLYKIDFDKGETCLAAPLHAEYPYARFNDGGCDRRGRLFAGTMHDPDNPASQGALYKFDAGRLHLIQNDIPVSNGLAWSPDGKIMYHADTRRHIIWQYDYNISLGIPENRRIFRQFGDALPDGLTVDSAGNVFVALYGDGSILCINPAGESLLDISLPVRHVTSCAFGGEHMTTLFITTASQDEDKESPELRPLCGQVFKAEMTVAGLSGARLQAFPDTG